MTESGLANHKVETLEKVEQIPNVKLLAPARQITFNYGHLQLQRVVSSLGGEVALRVDGHWKAIAVASGKADRLWCEDRLGGWFSGLVS